MSHLTGLFKGKMKYLHKPFCASFVQANVGEKIKARIFQ